MIKVGQKDSLLILTYSPRAPWVLSGFERADEVSIKNGIFTFFKSDLYSPDRIDEDESEVEFVIGRTEGDYFKIEPRILGIKQRIYIHKSMDITDRFFVVASDISIFKKIAEVVSEDIYIGGDAPTSLPESEFRKLLKDFPNPYEVKKYVHARIGSVLSNYYDSASDVEEKYDRYMNKRKSVKSEDLLEEFKQDELVKYQTLLDRLQVMLERETAYNEKQWQNEILDIILLLYPKYLFAFKEAPVRDAYNEKDRQLDFLLVDANGSIDIVEIKRPLGKQIITQGKYRDNHIPLRDLSGTVMQIEKYIFHLNKSGKKGEEKLTEKYKDKLPKDFKIKIINPCGMIIMGRDNDLSTAQKEDLEVVKRKYKSVIDIITYDDLLRRLKAMIAAIKKR